MYLTLQGLISLKSVAGFNFKIGLLFNYEEGGNTVTQKALFYNPRNQSVLIYNITFHHLNIYLLCLQKKRQYENYLQERKEEGTL